MSEPGNGKDLSNSFYQDEKAPPPYQGKENRSNRHAISPESQLILDEIRRIGTCRDDCVIPKEVHKDIPAVIEAGLEIGDGSIKDASHILRDQTKEVGKLLTTRSKVLDSALKILVGIGIMYVAGKMGWV